MDVSRLASRSHDHRHVLEIQTERRRARLQALRHADDRVASFDGGGAPTEVDVDVLAEERAELLTSSPRPKAVDRAPIEHFRKRFEPRADRRAGISAGARR